MALAYPWSSLALVRHAMPRVEDAVPARLWGLSEHGKLAVKGLRPPNFVPMCVVSSPEPKAIETVVLFTRRDPSDVVIDADFAEVGRDEPMDSDFRERRRDWIAGRVDSRHDSWEPFSHVGARMDAGLKRHDGATLIVGTHGMAMTCWLVHAGLIAPGEEAAQFWESLQFPSLVYVSHDACGRLTLAAER